MTNRSRVARAAFFWFALLIVGPCANARARADTPIAVWIDTDPAVGLRDRDVDDGLALLQAFHSPEIEIRGVSVVFGNAPLRQAWPIARELVRRFGPKGLRVYRGAAARSELGAESDASRALAAALSRERLVILALGPATNVATVVKNHPDLASRIVRVVGVAGRRPGQRFTTGTTNSNGHRDFNFEEDPEAFRVLLASNVPLTLAPFEVSSKVWLKREDLDLLSRGASAPRWIAAPARGWLALWKRTFAVDGFNPFDTLAVARVTSPSFLTCESMPARIDELPDDSTEKRMQGTDVLRKPYLLVSPDFPSPRAVEYCFGVTDAFKPDLLRRLGAHGPPASVEFPDQRRALRSTQ